MGEKSKAIGGVGSVYVASPYVAFGWPQRLLQLAFWKQAQIKNGGEFLHIPLVALAAPISVSRRSQKLRLAPIQAPVHCREVWAVDVNEESDSE